MMMISPIKMRKGGPRDSDANNNYNNSNNNNNKIIKSTIKYYKCYILTISCNERSYLQESFANSIKFAQGLP